MAGSNTLEIVISARDTATNVVRGVTDSIRSSFGNMTRQLVTAGAGLALMTAPMVAGLGSAVNEATRFQEAMVNTQSILQNSDAAMAGLSDQILELGANSRAGPQAVAEGFYTIVGAVADASSHMAILEASVSTAQAGNAALDGVISALTSTMNSYSFSADQASFVSDVLTATVQRGVGTMDDFASALPQVTGLASSMGVELDGLAGQLAYLTTQGFSASQSATFLRSMMTTLSNPTTQLAGAIQGLGFESGAALLEAEGLAGAYDLIRQAGGGAFDGLITNTEALQGALALTGEGADAFLRDFVANVDGATAAAEAVQMQSFSAQMDLVKSSISALKIEIGTALLPALLDVMAGVRPLVQGFASWARENPKLVTTIAAVVVGAAGLAGVITAVAGVAGALVPVLALIFSPLGLVLGIVVALGIAWKSNFLGMRDALKPVENAVKLFGKGIAQTFGLIASGENVFDALRNGIGYFVDDIARAFGATEEESRRLQESFMEFTRTLQNDVFPALLDVGRFIASDVLPIVGTLATLLAGFVVLNIRAFAMVWRTVIPPMMAVVEVIRSDVIPIITMLGTMVAAGIQNITTAFEAGGLSAVGELLGNGLRAALGAALAAVVNEGPVLAQGILDAIGAGWQNLTGWLDANFSTVMAGALAAAITAGGAILGAVANYGPDILAAMAASTPDVAGWVGSTFLDAMVLQFELAVAAGGLLHNALVTYGPDILAAIASGTVDIAGWVTTNFTQAMTDAFALAIGVGGNLQTAVSTYGPQILNAIALGIPVIGDWVQQQFTQLMANAFSAAMAGDGVIKAVVDGYGPAIWAAILAGLGEVAVWVNDNIITPMRNGLDEHKQALVDAFTGLGGDIVAGLEAGLNSAWDGFVARLEGLYNSLPGVLRDVLEILSPSRVMMRLGEQVVMGLQIGMMDDSGIRAAATNLGEAAVPAIPAPSGVAGGAGGVNPSPTGANQAITINIENNFAAGTTAQQARELGRQNADGLTDALRERGVLVG